MNKHKPIIFLAFANNKVGENGFLRQLSQEENGIRNALKQAKKEGLCELIIRHSITIDELFTVFQEHQNRIAIFHFGGHANSYQLLLKAADESKKPAYQAGLMAFLARQDNLELVFLNGCSTEQQVMALQTKGVPAVIGTVEEVKDEVAQTLAVQFYKGLGKGIPLELAWKHAEDNVQTKEGGDIRGLYRKNRKYQPSFFPWILKIREGAKNVKNWNLPKAGRNPYFGLPQINNYDLPHQPYRFLGRYEKEDARIFFGRGRKIRELYFRVTDGLSAPVILLSGRSGVGKSSLLDAGLLPRLEGNYQIKYVRRSPELGLVEALEQVLFPAIDDQQSPDLLKDGLTNWKKIEQEKKQPLVIILDQAEGVFTRVSQTQSDELSAFLKVLKSLFDKQESRPLGKLIFSFRKEHHQEFITAFNTHRIPFEDIFLKPLEKADIIEVIEGLASTESLKRKYTLTIEPGLANQIADELIADKESPIAPILQIILTKLWQQQELLSQRNFSKADYQKLKEDGILLEDFYQQQMEKIEFWDKKNGKNAVESGLALDILDFHTTQWQVAESQTLQTLREKYEHRKDILEDLLYQFDTAYLLAYLSKDKTALAHDTLAPVVKYNMKISDKPGQKARRILETKTVNYEQDKETIIEPEDLDLVEKGKEGMRVWTIQEQNLVDKSRAYRDEREAERRINQEYREKAERIKKRNRQWLIGLVFIIGVGGILFGWFANQNARLSALTAQALAEEKVDPTTAFKTIQKALAIDADDDIAIQTQHDIFSDNEFYNSSLSLGSIQDLKVLSNGNILLALEDTVKFLDKNRQFIWEEVQNDQVLCVDASKDGEQLLVGGRAEVIKIYNSKGTLIQQLKGHESRVTAATFSSDGRKILSGDGDGHIFLWENDSIQQVFEAHSKEIGDLCFLDDDRHFVSGSWDCSSKLWSIDNGWIKDLPVTEQGLAISFSKQNEIIAIGDRSGSIYFLNKEGILITKILAHKLRINSLKFSKNGKMLLSASDDKMIKLWDTKGHLLKVYKGHEDFVKSLDFAPDNKAFYSGSQDKSLKKWNIESKVQEHYGQHDKEVSDMVMTQKEPLLISISGDGKQGQMNQVHDCFFDVSNLFGGIPPQKGLIWNRTSHQLMGELVGHKQGIYAVDINLNNKRIVTGGADATVILWDTKGNKTKTLEIHKDRINDVAFSPDGQYLATVSHDSMLIIINVEDSFSEVFLKKHEHPINKVVFSPNGQQILSGTFDIVANLFDLEGQLLHQFDENSAAITDLAISDNGKYVLIADLKNKAVLYTIKGEPLGVFEISQKTKTGGQGINAVAFSSDGRYIALAGLAGITEIIDVKNGRIVQTLHNLWLGGVFSVAFSSDGQWIFTGSQDGFVRKYKFYH